MLIELGLVINVIEDCAAFDGSAKLATVRTIVVNVFIMAGAV